LPRRELREKRRATADPRTAIWQVLAVRISDKCATELAAPFGVEYSQLADIEVVWRGLWPEPADQAGGLERMLEVA
jgi:hypothetical protein